MGEEDVAMEDGELAPGLEFRFASMDQGAGAARPVKKKRKKSGQKNKSKNADPNANRRNIEAGMQGDLRAYVNSICRHLNEKKFFMVETAVETLGMMMINDLIKEVDEIEKNGGQMTQDGSRRRTPGGVLLNLLKSRIEPDLYRTIITSSNKRAVEFAKRRREMEEEPRDGRKRRRLNNKDDEIGKPEIVEQRVDPDRVVDDVDICPSMTQESSRQVLSYGDLF